MSWKYGKKTHEPTVGSGWMAREKIVVGKDEDVTFNITCGEGVKIKGVTSDYASHSVPSLSGDKTSFVCTLKAEANFKLTARLAPVASVKWKKYLDPAGSYTSGTITYGSGQTFQPTSTIAETAVVKGQPVTCKIDGFNSETHYVEKWVVNGADVTPTDSAYELIGGTNKTELKILDAQGEYEVEVVVKKFRTVTVCLFEGVSGHHPYTPLTNHNCKIEVKKIDGSSAPPLEPESPGENKREYKYLKIKPGTELAIIATLKSSSIYEMQSWTYEETGGGETHFNAEGDGTHKKTIYKDTTINVLLKKKMFDLNLEFSGEESGVHHNFILEVYNTDATPNSEIHPKTAGSYE